MDYTEITRRNQNTHIERGRERMGKRANANNNYINKIENNLKKQRDLISNCARVANFQDQQKQQQNK